VRDGEAARGEFQAESRRSFREYATEWVERYQGRGRPGFRESTRDDYRRLLNAYAFEYFGNRRLSEINAHKLARYVAWFAEQKTPTRKLADGTLVGGEPISDSTIRNAVNPVRACLATAVTEGLIRTNPTHGLALPHRLVVLDDEEDVRALSRSQLGAFLAIVNPTYRLLFRFLAITGLRASECFELRWKDLRLDGSNPHVRMRRAIVRGRVVPLKTGHGKRNVPLDAAMVDALRAHRRESEWHEDSELVFPSTAGTHLRIENIHRRVLKPVAQEVGAPWCGLHTFRHTCASLLFDRARNVVQVQRWLGHGSVSFTLNTYVSLLDGRIGEPVNLDQEIGDAAEQPTEQMSRSETEPVAARPLAQDDAAVACETPSRSSRTDPERPS
jgi:integrase